MSTYFNRPAPYPTSALHLVSANAAREVRWHLKAPDAMIGMSFVTIMGVACQGLADVALPIFETSRSNSDDEAEAQLDRIIPLSMNLISIAESGERKTTVDNTVGAPIYANDEQQAIKHESDKAADEMNLSIWVSIQRGLRRKLTKLAEKGEDKVDAIADLKEHEASKPKELRLRRVVRGDITKTSIAEALRGEGESIALMSNEGDILLNGEAMKHLSWLNSAWDGSSLSLDRGNNRNILARHPRVTTSIYVQPSVFHDYVEAHGKKARGLGYFARYLVGWPESTQGQRFISGYEGKWTHLPLFHARVTELLEEYSRRVASGAPKRDVLRFTADAKARWISLVNSTEESIHPQGELREVKDFAAKSCEITARLAGILHYFSKQVGGITVDTLERAIEIVAWHLSEYGRIFMTRDEVPQALKDAEKLRAYLYRMQMERTESNRNYHNKPKDPQMFARSEANHCGPVRKGPFKAALEVLVARDIVRVHHLYDTPKPSGPLTIFFSNEIGHPLRF